MKSILRRTEETPREGSPSSFEYQPFMTYENPSDSYSRPDNENIASTARVLPLRERSHQRAWSLESDLRISRVILSPLLPFESDQSAVGPPTLGETSSTPSVVEGLPSRLALPDIPSSRSFLSSVYSQDRQIDSSLPSWPSSVLFQADSRSETSSRDASPALNCYSPASRLSDRATENSFSPRTPHSLTPIQSITTRTQSPLVLDRAAQVDEFGRIVMTFDSNKHINDGVPSQARQVRFVDQTTVFSDSVLSGPNALTPTSMTSRDTFGIRLSQEEEEEEVEDVPTSPTEAHGDSSFAFEIQPGTPLLLASSKSPEIDVDNVQIQPNTSLFRFPILCEAVIAQSPPNKVPSSVTSALSSGLLPPIELKCDKQVLNEQPHSTAFARKKDEVPRKGHRRGAIPISRSDGSLMRRRQGVTSLYRPRASSTADLAKEGFALHRLALPMRSSVRRELPSVPEQYPVSPISDSQHLSDHSSIAAASMSESNPSVRSIIAQQRLAMERLTQAGFWTARQTKTSAVQEEALQLPSMPREELVSRVRQWAWLLSSEADHEEDTKQAARPSSPLAHPHAESRSGTPNATEEQAACRSWEWLGSEDHLVEDSFESSSTTLATMNNERRPGQVGLGLDDVMAVSYRDGTLTQDASAAIDLVKERSAETAKGNNSPDVNTPELGSRESRTTAAIEALLSQVQLSHDSLDWKGSSSSSSRKLGASFLYRQLLNKIAEEEDN